MSNRRKLRPPQRGIRADRVIIDDPVRFPSDAAFWLALRESAAAPAVERAELREAVTTAITEAPTAGPSNAIVDLILIEAGWNTTGSRYYPAEVLARDVPTVMPAGTHMYWDHPTATEEVERPERSLSTLAAVLVEDPHPVDGGRQMKAKARVYAPYQPMLREAWQDIGVSINADGTGTFGEREGRKGLIVEAITYGKSVDFVTKPGAGGRIVSLLESARTTALREARTFGAWLESRLHLALTQYADEAYGDGRLTREERITLSAAISDGLRAWTARVEADAPQLFQRDLYDDPARDVAATEAERLREATAGETQSALGDAVKAAYGSNDTYTWVRDWDPDRSLVWYEVGGPDGATTWQQGYSVSDGAVTLTDGRVAVQARTVYEPVTADTDVTESDATPPEQPDVPETPAPRDSPAQQPGDSTTEDAPGSPPADEETEGVMPEDLTTEVKAREAAEQARVEAETKLAEALRKAEEAEKLAAENALKLARVQAVESARPIATTALAESDLPAAAQTRVLTAVTRDVPLTESNNLDETAFKTLVEAEIKAEAAYLASLQEADGAGRVRGMGGSPAALTESATPAQSEADTTALIEAYKARGLSPEAAQLAARGRAF